jgi:hypothetical protein
VNPDFPVYIISKGRWESRQTSRALEKMHVPYRIVIEPQELAQYAEMINPSKILVLPFSNLGQGSIPARNWVWEHSISEGYERHWILDDNIQWFGRIHQNKKTKMLSGACFCVVEDFVARYENIALAGLQYEMFMLALSKAPPVCFNTRIYSCILILNSLPFRWRGRYNEDTDLSIRCLKAGWCTCLVHQFVCKKTATMKMKGGNTDELYKGDWRLKMAQSLQRQHPDVCRIVRKWGRWQHHVDYRPFKRNKLILKPEFVGKKWDQNEYGMKLVDANWSKL